MMEINRRRFISSGVVLGSAFASAALLPTGKEAEAKELVEQLFASAYTDLQGDNFIAITDQQGAFKSSVSVPSRGHSACFTQDGKRAAFFARRPGRWLKVLNIESGTVEASIVAESGRHFFGHGVYSSDGRYLYSSENDFENARGVIGIYDARKGYRRVGEIDSAGIGPHELAILSDEKTLVVANGGIETHPEFGRRKLNLDSMKPNLTYIDIETKAVVEQVEPPHFQLSLRHLDLDKNDNVVIGAQYQGDPRDDHPLVFHHQRGQNLKAMSKQSLKSQRMLNQYIASVTFTHNGDYVLTSAPRGDRVSIWNARDWQWLGDVPVTDVGGVAPVRGSSNMILTSGSGDVFEWQPPSTELIKLNQLTLHWDNHIRST